MTSREIMSYVFEESDFYTIKTIFKVTILLLMTQNIYSYIIKGLVIALISVNIVPRWNIYGRSQARVLRYPKSGQYSPISVQ